MGGSGSTRRVVVEETEGSGVVKISDSVVQRIRGLEPSKVPGPDTPCPAPPPDPCGPCTPVCTPCTPPRDDQQPCPPKLPFPSFGKRADVKEIERYYMNRLKELEGRNTELQKITQQQFCKAVEEVEKKFMNYTGSPVCQDLQQCVYDCYLANPNTTLMCSAQVRAFSTCVEKARQSGLMRKG